MSDDLDGKFLTQIANGRLSSECTAGFEFDEEFVAGVDTADCRLRDLVGSLLDTGLLERREFDEPLLVELQLLGLRECDRLDALPPHGDSEPDLDFFFLIDDFDEHSVSEVRRSVVVSYALSGVTTTAALATLPYMLLVLLLVVFELSYQELDDILCNVTGFDLKLNKTQVNIVY